MNSYVAWTEVQFDHFVSVHRFITKSDVHAGTQPINSQYHDKNRQTIYYQVMISSLTYTVT